MTLTSGTGSTYDDTARAAIGPAIDPALAQRLADPAVANALASLLDHADLLAILVQGLDQMVARTEVIGNSLVDGLTEVRGAVEGARDGVDIDLASVISSLARLAEVLPKATPGMVNAVESGVIDRLLSSEVVNPRAVDQVAVIAQGLVQGADQFETGPVPVKGLRSMRRLLRDPDVNRALSYFATVAKSVGHELGKPAAGTPPTS